MHFQILVHPQRVERCCVKACQEHIHYDKQIQFLVLHTERNILIVVLELIAGCIVVRMEHFIVVADGGFQKVAGVLVKCGGIFWVLLVQNAVNFLLIRSITVNNRNFQILGRVIPDNSAELVIVEFCHWDRGHGKNRVKSTQPLFPLNLFDLAAIG